jgi:hypothetical protein
MNLYIDSSVFSVPVMDAGAIFFSSNFFAAGDGFLKRKLLLELLLQGAAFGGFNLRLFGLQLPLRLAHHLLVFSLYRLNKLLLCT